MYRKIFLFLVISFLFILLISFVNALNTITSTYNYNSNENIGQILQWSTKTSLNDPPINLLEGGSTTDVTSNTEFDALDANNKSFTIYYLSGTYNGGQRFKFNLSLSNTASISNINWTITAKKDYSYATCDLYMWDFNNTSWVKYNSITTTTTLQTVSISNSTNPLNYINYSSNNATYMFFICNSTNGANGNPATDFVQLQITYSSSPNETLNFPVNNTNSSKSLNYFNATFNDNYGLKNTTLYIWNSTGTNFTNSTNISGTTNSTNLSLSLADGTYTWNYLVFNSMNNSNWSSNNYTLTVDSTSPNATLLNPLNNSYNNTNQNFTANLTDNLGLKNATLFIYNSSGSLINQTNFTLNNLLQSTIGVIVNLIDGVYTWFYQVYDYTGNLNQTTNFTFTKDATFPQINITYPINNSNISSSTITINYTRSDTNLDSCWYSNDTYSTNTTIPSCNNLTITLSQGNHNFTIWNNDSARNINSSSVTFNIDSINPNINIVTPVNGTNSTNVNLNVNYTLNDIHLSSCSWTGNGSINPINCGQNITTQTWSQGWNIINITTVDTFGNENSSQVSFFIDNVPPTITIYHPNSEPFTSTTITANFSIIDPSPGVGISTCWWKNDTGSNLTISPCSNFTFTQAVEGTHTFYLWANDTLGNNASASSIYTVAISYPAVSLLYPTFLPNPQWLNNGTNININWSAQQANGIKNCTIYSNWTNGNWIVNYTNTTSIAGGSQINYNYKVNLSDGYYTWNAYCWEGTGLKSSWSTQNWTFGIDTIYPQLTLSSPSNQTYTTNQLKLNYSATDLNRDICWYNINNTANITLASCNNITFTANQGSSILRLFVNDSANNINSNNISFFVDSINPNIILNTSFSNGSYLNYNQTDFNISVSDTNLDSCWYNYNGTNTFFTCGNNVSLNLSDNFYTINFYDNDTLNNLNQTNISFTVDTIPPEISNIQETTQNQNQLFSFTYSVNDTNLGLCKYSFDNGLSNASIILCGSVNNAIIPILDIPYNLTVYASDLAGNENSTTKTISISSSVPISNPGGGGGSPSNQTISTIAIKNENSTLTDLQKAIIYANIRSVCLNVTPCTIPTQNQTNLLSTFLSYGIVMTSKELTDYLNLYNSNSLEVVQMLQSDVDTYKLFNGLIQNINQKIILTPNKLDPFFAISGLFSDEFTYEIQSNKIISNVSLINSELGLSIEKTSDTTANVILKVENKDFSAKVFTGTGIFVDESGDVTYLDISIRTINLRSPIIIISLFLVVCGIILFIFRKKIFKIKG